MSVNKIVLTLGFCIVILNGCGGIEKNAFIESTFIENVKIKDKSLEQIKLTDWDNEKLDILFSSSFSTIFYNMGDDSRDYWNFDDFSDSEEIRYEWTYKTEEGTPYEKTKKAVEFLKDIEIYIYEKYGIHEENFRENMGYGIQWGLLEGKLVASFGVFLVNGGLIPNVDLAFISLYLTEDATFEDGIIKVNFNQEHKVTSQFDKLPNISIEIDTTPLDTSSVNDLPSFMIDRSVFNITINMDGKYKNSGICINDSPGYSAVMKWSAFNKNAVNEWQIVNEKRIKSTNFTFENVLKQVNN